MGTSTGQRKGGDNNAGTVFKITLSGTLTTLYRFCSKSGCRDGDYPYAGLVQATDGNLYGTTTRAAPPVTGRSSRSPKAASCTTLYRFCSQSNCPDGAVPFAGLVQASDGNFYGTTYYGGTYNYGTIFRLSVGLGQFVEAQPTSGKVEGGNSSQDSGLTLTGATGVTFDGAAREIENKQRQARK